MNERIKQIAEQTIGTNPKYAVAMIIASPELEQFAELLIRESARIADMVSENKVEWVGGNILTYFGVQE